MTSELGDTKRTKEDGSSPHPDVSAEEPPVRDQESYLKTAKDRLREDGVFPLDDPSIGEYLSEFEAKGFPFHSEWAWDQANKHVLKDPIIRKINEDDLKDYVMVHWFPQQPFPGHIFRYLPYGIADLSTYTILLCPKGSKINYYHGSHRIILNKITTNIRGIPEIPKSLCDEAQCPSVAMSLPHGGKVMLDARAGFEIVEGFVHIMQFAKVGVAHYWTKTPVHESLESKIQGIELGSGIKVNVKFSDKETRKLHSQAQKGK